MSKYQQKKLQNQGRKANEFFRRNFHRFCDIKTIFGKVVSRNILIDYEGENNG